MELFDNALNFLADQFGKTKPESFSQPARGHIETIRAIFQRAEENPDQFSAASMGALAEACGNFILSRRQNPKPVSFRTLVLMDAAYTMIESIAERAKENGHMPTRHKVKIDRAMKQANEALPGWPSRGTFFRLECAINAGNSLSSDHYRRLSDTQFTAVERIKYLGIVVLSNAAKAEDFTALMKEAKDILPASPNVSEHLRMVAFHIGDAKNPVAQMQSIVATPLPQHLQVKTTLPASLIEFKIGPDQQRRRAA